MTEAAPVRAATSFARPAHPGFGPLLAVAAKDRPRHLHEKESNRQKQLSEWRERNTERCIHGRRSMRRGTYAVRLPSVSREIIDRAVGVIVDMSFSFTPK